MWKDEPTTTKTPELLLVFPRAENVELPQLLDKLPAWQNYVFFSDASKVLKCRYDTLLFKSQPYGCEIVPVVTVSNFNQIFRFQKSLVASIYLARMQAAISIHFVINFSLLLPLS